MNNFQALSNWIEHIEPKSSVKNMAADQIKRACQNYWGGLGSLYFGWFDLFSRDPTFKGEGKGSFGKGSFRRETNARGARRNEGQESIRMWAYPD